MAQEFRPWQSPIYWVSGIVTGVTAGIIVSVISDLRKEVSHSLTESPAYKVEGPLASVIIPALEEESYLPNLLTSIQNQTYGPIEVIVADSSAPESHERTEEICRQYGAKCIYVPKLGVALARNEGAKEARGNILIFSDADNVMAPECVENLVRSLAEGYIIANPVECIMDDGIAAFGVLWANNWFKSSSKTTRCIAIWRDPFWEVDGYDETCDPMQGCREDLKLGRDIVERFGETSTRLVRDALVGTSSRRTKAQGIDPRVLWKYRGARNSHIIEY